MSSLGLAKYRSAMKTIEITTWINDPYELVREVARCVYELAERQYPNAVDGNVFYWGRKTQKLLLEEFDAAERNLDELIPKHLPIQMLYDDLEKWAAAMLELYRRYHDFLNQRRKQVV